MIEVLRFVYSHLEEIIMILYSAVMIVIAFISLIVLICKKLKSTDNDLTWVLGILPRWIQDAELLFTDGKEKFSYVYSSAIKALSSLKDLSEDKVVKKYSFIISSSIEDILSTPMKKEVNHAKNNEKMER